MRTSSFVLAAAAASVFVLLSSADARACSAPRCYGATAHLLPAPGATVPANAPGVVVFAGRSIVADVEPAIALVRTLDGVSEPVAFETVEQADKTKILVPAGGLELGAKYDATVGATCEGGQTATTSFTVAAASPKPASLGALVVRGLGIQPLSVSSSGPCTESISATQVEVEVALAAEAQPWKSLLRYETYVDGKRWFASSNATAISHPAGSWKGIGKDLVFAACGKTQGGFAGLPQGSHRVQVRAYLPGEGARFLESPATDIVLSCGTPTVPPVGSTTASPVGSGGGVAEDMPSYEPIPEGTSASNGCSAAAGNGSDTVSAFGIALGVVAVAVAARRKRR